MVDVQRGKDIPIKAPRIPLMKSWTPQKYFTGRQSSDKFAVRTRFSTPRPDISLSRNDLILPSVVSSAPPFHPGSRDLNKIKHLANMCRVEDLLKRYDNVTESAVAPYFL